MSIVHLNSVEILNAEAKFQDPYIFKITFECISPLQDDIEWKLVYVGSAGDEKYDQELDNCMVGPVPVGKYIPWVLLIWAMDGVQAIALPRLQRSQLLVVCIADMLAAIAAAGTLHCRSYAGYVSYCAC